MNDRKRLAPAPWGVGARLKDMGAPLFRMSQREKSMDRAREEVGAAAPLPGRSRLVLPACRWTAGTPGAAPALPLPRCTKALAHGFRTRKMPLPNEPEAMKSHHFGGVSRFKSCRLFHRHGLLAAGSPFSLFRQTRGMAARRAGRGAQSPRFPNTLCLRGVSRWSSCRVLSPRRGHSNAAGSPLFFAQEIEA